MAGPVAFLTVGGVVFLRIIRPSNDIAVLRGRLLEFGMASGEVVRSSARLETMPRYVRVEDVDRKQTPASVPAVILVYHASEKNRPVYEPLFDSFLSEPLATDDVLSVADLVDERNALRKK